MKSKALFFLVGMSVLALPVLAQINLLHEFAGATADGKYPWGDLIISGTTLYGMTQYGGGNDKGTIFKVQTDGSGFALLHEFAGSSVDGKYPMGSLILSGSTLYGMTTGGSTDDHGSIFKLETDGSGFTLLHSFAGGSAGEYPTGSLVLSGSTLYGMSEGFSGTIFKIQTDGSDFTTLHTFTVVPVYEGSPKGSLTISGSTLYGMTYDGGSSRHGTIFKMQTDGSDYTLLYEFSGGIGDGRFPYGSLLLSGSTLFGMASFGMNGMGGPGDPRVLGTIFKINTDGSGFALLHAFPFPLIAAEGMQPHGSLILSGSTLFGMTHGDGSSSYGTVFQMQTDGTGFTPLHTFAGGMDDGRYPEGSLILAGSVLYGMTNKGGDSDFGVVFSLPLPSSIAVISPNGGEILAIGGSHEITWSSTGMIDNVNIDYSIDGGGSWTSIITGTENDGGYSWTVPNTPSGSCLVRVSDMASPAVTDASDASFTISAPFVAVTSPNGGEAWQRGTAQAITWISAGVANIKIQLLKGTLLYSTITPSAPATSGSYIWNIPVTLPVAANYKIRIVSKTDSAVKDSSDGYFTIFAPAITVTAPAAGSIWARNTVMAIAWTTKGTMAGNVKIQLFKGITKKLDIILSTENDGSYDWPIPAALAKGTYTIRITTLDNKVKGKSGAFTLANIGGI